MELKLQYVVDRLKVAPRQSSMLNVYVIRIRSQSPSNGLLLKNALPYVTSDNLDAAGHPLTSNYNFAGGRVGRNSF